MPDLPGLGRALQAVAFPPQGRTDGGLGRVLRRRPDGRDGTGGRRRPRHPDPAAGSPVANAGDVLDLAADGRAAQGRRGGLPRAAADETAGRITELVTLLLALAALRSGAARWRHSWTGTAELVAADGATWTSARLAALVADPATVAAARERLAALGIDPAAGQGRTGAPAEVVGGLVNLVVDGSRTDLLIVDTGLFLVPGLPRSQNGSAKRRLARFAAAGAARRRRARQPVRPVRRGGRRDPDPPRAEGVGPQPARRRHPERAHRAWIPTSCPAAGRPWTTRSPSWPAPASKR